MKFITPVEITPGTASSWQDADVSSYAPSGTTGVVLHFEITTNATYGVGWRKNGSTDNRTQSVPPYNAAGAHFWCTCGVDGSRILELYVDNKDNVNVWLVGYFESEAVFDTNLTDISVTKNNAWHDKDVSSLTTGTAICIFTEYYTVNGDYGLRKNGSTDTLAGQQYQHGAALCGLDGSEICEMKLTNASDYMFLQGYMTSGAVLYTNKTNVDMLTAGSWLDLPGYIGQRTLQTANQSGWNGYTAIVLRTDADLDAGATNDATITSISVQCSGSGNISFKVFRDDGTNFLVVYSSSLQAAVAGLNTYSGLSISIARGDLLGIYYESNNARGNSVSNGVYYKSGNVTTDSTKVGWSNYGTSMSIGASFVSCVGRNANGIFMEILGTGTPAPTWSTFGIRKNGSSEDIYRGAGGHPFAIVEGDTNKAFEGKQSESNVTFWTAGYPTSGAKPSSMIIVGSLPVA